MGIVDVRVLPVRWIEDSDTEDSVTSLVYLEDKLQGTMWQAVRAVATRQHYLFKQDKTSCPDPAPWTSLLLTSFSGAR